MDCEDRAALDLWIARWSDLVEFDVSAVIPTAEAARKVGQDVDSKAEHGR